MQVRKQFLRAIAVKLWKQRQWPKDRHDDFRRLNFTSYEGLCDSLLVRLKQLDVGRYRRHVSDALQWLAQQDKKEVERMLKAYDELPPRRKPGDPPRRHDWVQELLQKA